MGKGLEKKQEEQHEYLENERLKEATQQRTLELLGQIPPEKARQLEVLSSGCLPPEALTLVGRLSADGKRVEFLHGDTVCGTGDPAEVKALGAPLNQTLFTIMSDEDGVLCLQAATVDRKAHRPPVENGDG